MRLTEEQHERRWIELPDEIRNLSNTEAMVHKLVQLYICGRIATKDELLLQIIIHLHTDWGKMRQNYLALQRMQVTPLILTQP